MVGDVLIVKRDGGVLEVGVFDEGGFGVVWGGVVGCKVCWKVF